MKKLFQKAFTLVELLIVIAIIGILAVAILVGLDPIEQVNRANDTKLVTASGEIRGAINRYYAANQKFPWCADTSCAAYLTPFTVSGTTYATCVTGASSLFNDSASASCAEGVLAALVASGDLKSGITADAKLGLTPVTLTTFQITYNPYSKSERVKYATAVGNPGIYTTAACTVVGTTAACPNTSTTCQYCVF